MKKPLQILIVEDNPDDAEMLLAELRRAGFDPQWKRIETEPDFLAELNSSPDIIFSDYSMPQFNGLRAAELLQASNLEIPFILISGTVGEEVAVEAMKRGATDYLLKDRIVRLGSAVERALTEKKSRAARKQVEAALLEREEQYRKVVESSPDGIFILQQNRFVLLNAAALKLFGASRQDELLGRDVFTFIHPNFHGPMRERIVQAAQQEHPMPLLEEKLLRLDGSMLEAEVTSTPFQFQGQPALLVEARDITERKRTEKLLQEREEQLRLYAEHSPAAIAMFDRDMKYLVASRRWMEVYHLGDRSIIGRSHYQVFPEIPQRWREIHQRCLAGAVEKCDEDVFPRTDGPADLIRWEIRPWRQADGAIGGIIIFSEDITSRKRMEDELRWRNALFEAQMDSSLDGILVVDSEGRKILQSQRFTELLKIPRHIAEDQNDGPQLQFVTGQIKDAKSFADKVAYLNAHPDEVSRDEVELVDGTILDRYSSPVRDKAGQYYGRIWAFRDITQQRKLEQQFRQMQKMESIGQLAGGIAHDFNNILGAIMGYTELARSELADDAPVREYLDQIAKASDRAVALVRQILTFSRQQEHERKPIQLKFVIEEALKLLRATVTTSIEFKTSLAQAPAVLADATAIHQIIMNLGTNAWHAMKDQPGTLTVELLALDVDAAFAAAHPDLHPGRYVCLTVGDTGSGMDRTTLDRIFDPFFTTKKTGEGTGLGLAVVHGIMKSHEGGISVNSQPGKGTVFHLYFPAIATAVVEAAGQSAPAPHGNGERILFVEDEAPLATLGKMTLEKLGYAVTVKASPLEALAALRGQPGQFDLVITDFNMPVMDGTQLAAELLKLQPGLPIILVSGYRGTLTDEKVKELGFHALLLKPNTVQTLGEAAHRVLHPAKPAT